MSYCRWSSDGFTCDVYCYEHYAGGFPIHIATHKRVGEGPCPHLPVTSDVDEFMECYKAQQAWLNASQLVPIGLPHDGETWYGRDARDCANKLEELRRIGYCVPQYAIDQLRYEADHPEEGTTNEADPID